ncbi:MAG: hypothetical protein NC904_07870 [Candidatus Omnitrophica bacterium]|nr:hypothetical protein [Candidatus Omnitrophota bacterium]
MKMVMIAYNEAIDEEVMEILHSCTLKNYTKIKGIFGRGDASGAHLGNDIWPGRNNLLFISIEDKDSKDLILGIKELRKKLGKEGIKAFLWNLEEVT